MFPEPLSVSEGGEASSCCWDRWCTECLLGPCVWTRGRWSPAYLTLTTCSYLTRCFFSLSSRQAESTLVLFGKSTGKDAHRHTAPPFPCATPVLHLQQRMTRLRYYNPLLFWCHTRDEGLCPKCASTMRTRSPPHTHRDIKLFDVPHPPVSSFAPFSPATLSSSPPLS